MRKYTYLEKPVTLDHAEGEVLVLSDLSRSKVYYFTVARDEHGNVFFYDKHSGTTFFGAMAAVEDVPDPDLGAGPVLVWRLADEESKD